MELPRQPRQQVAMNGTSALLLGLIPAALIFGGVGVLRKIPPRHLFTRRALLLLQFSAILLLFSQVITRLLSRDVQPVSFWVSIFSIPAILSIVVLILFRIPKIRLLTRQDQITLMLPTLLISAVLAYSLVNPAVIGDFLPLITIVLIVGWFINERQPRLVWAPAAIVLLMWGLVNGQATGQYTQAPGAIRVLVGISWLMVPVLTVGVIAMLFTSGLDLGLSTAFTPGVKNYRVARVEGSLRLLTALLLLVVLANSIMWASIWDQTTDGLGGVTFNFYSVAAALLIGLVMVLRTSALRRLAGLTFMILVPLITSTAFAYGWQVNFPNLTEKRAAQVASALERYYRRENRYPAQLNELAPRDILLVPQPVMFRGETWCYQGSEDGYRLAAFYHKYFGLPVSLDLYASAGDFEDQPLPCAERLAEMQARFDWTNLPLSISTSP